MDPVAKYLVLSLPASTDAHEWLEKSLNGGKCPINPFKVPEFQVGTLDLLVQESDDLQKLDAQLAGSIAKVVDILSAVSELGAARFVNGTPVLRYVESFTWNTLKYRVDKSIGDLIKIIGNEAISLDGDVRATYQQYQTAKSNFLAADRKKNGDLSIKSLHDIVRAEQFVTDSEHLTTVLIAVPKSQKLDFELSYETLVEFVIPRSAEVIAQDLEYYLYTVTLFKKYANEFVTKCREKKWSPRTDFEYSEDKLNEMRKEFDTTRATELRSKNDLLRLVKTAYSDIFAAWFHIKAIRVYVESVLRYGLPPQFDCLLVKFDGANTKNVGKARKELVAKFGYLGGDGFSGKSNLNEYASLVDTEYEPFVMYEVDVV